MIGTRFAIMTHLRLIDWVLVSCAGLVPLIAVFAHKGSVILLSVAGGLALVTAVTNGHLKAIFTQRLAILFAAGLIWLVAATMISPDPASGFLKIAKICMLGILFAALAWQLRSLPEKVKTAAIVSQAWGTMAALVVLAGGYLAIGVFGQQLVEIEREPEISVLYPGIVTSALLLPGVLGYLRKSRRIGMMWGAAVGAILLSLAVGSMTVTVLVAVTLGLFMAFRDNPWYLPRLLALVLVVVTVTLPVSMPLVLDRVAVAFVENGNPDGEGGKTVAGSTEHRYLIWRFAADRAAERPFLGWGFNASRSLPGGHELTGERAELLPLHPHNAVLQVWLELGVPGLLLLCVVLWRTYMPPGWENFPRRELLIRTLTVTAVFIAASATFGIWQSWWLATIALALASTSLWHEGAEA
ncbi:MAG: O-antigen ligase family protein [Rhodospirillales bacterium]